MRRRVTEKEEPQLDAADEPLHVRYRPKTLGDVVGQDAVVRSLKKLLNERSRPHSFLFTGPAGCGKTSLARILAAEFKCESQNIIEVDAATNSGIDAMRELTSTLRYNGFGDTPNKCFILDEAHALSKASWDSLLKSVEEPPSHIYFFFCTTAEGKVPQTIVTRCHSYALQHLRFDDLMDLLECVCKKEKLDIPDKHLQMVTRACGGSPRQALVMLSMVRGCEDDEEVASLLATPLENKEVIDLCRLMVREDLTWEKVQENLKALGEMPAESIRIVVVSYLTSCLMGAKSDKEAMRLLDMLEVFSKPCLQTDKLAPLLVAFGRYVFP